MTLNVKEGIKIMQLVTLNKWIIMNMINYPKQVDMHVTSRIIDYNAMVVI